MSETEPKKIDGPRFLTDDLVAYHGMTWQVVESRLVIGIEQCYCFRLSHDWTYLLYKADGHEQVTASSDHMTLISAWPHEPTKENNP